MTVHHLRMRGLRLLRDVLVEKRGEVTERLYEVHERYAPHRPGHMRRGLREIPFDRNWRLIMAARSRDDVFLYFLPRLFEWMHTHGHRVKSLEAQAKLPDDAPRALTRLAQIEWSSARPTATIREWFGVWWEGALVGAALGDGACIERFFGQLDKAQFSPKPFLRSWRPADATRIHHLYAYAYFLAHKASSPREFYDPFIEAWTRDRTSISALEQLAESKDITGNVMRTIKMASDAFGGAS